FHLRSPRNPCDLRRGGVTKRAFSTRPLNWYTCEISRQDAMNLDCPTRSATLCMRLEILNRMPHMQHRLGVVALPRNSLQTDYGSLSVWSSSLLISLNSQRCQICHYNHNRYSSFGCW